jgi:TonB-linked SusC/RagA family outer membrane protein
VAQQDTTKNAQERVISGRVTSSTGESLPGVAVHVKGLFIGTSTDTSGHYTLTVPAASKIIVFTYVGMLQQEITLNGENVINVVMAPDQMQLGEVVITALGIPNAKQSIGYSTQEISSDQLTMGGQTDVMNGVAAKTAGVQVISSSGTPGSSVYVKARGTTSLLGDNQLLIVVDGVPLANTFQPSGNPDDAGNNLLANVPFSNRGIDINPYDIESVTILKGPAATALYGISASNGAMLITTKKGTTTEGKSFHVLFNSSASVDVVNRLPELQNTFLQGSHGSYRGPETGASGSWGPNADTMFWDGDATYQYDTHGHLVGQSDPTAKEKFVPYDNLKQFFRPGYTYSNSISLTGGSQFSSFWVSYSNLSQTGIVPLSDFKRNTVRVSGTSALSSKFSLSASMSYVNSGGRRVQQGSNLSGLMLDLTRTPVSFDNSNGSDDPEDPKAYMFDDGTQRNYRGGGGYDNPYWTINKNPFNDDVNRVFGYTELSYDPITWLSFKYRVGTDMYTDRRKQAFDIYSRAAPAGQIFQDNYFYRHFNSDFFLIAEKALSEKINGSLTLGNNIYSQYFQQLYVEGDGLQIPGFYNMINASTILTRESVTQRRSYAFFGDAKLDYKSMVYLEVTGRNEKTSTLPMNKSFFYPSVSGAFVFTEALGMKDNKVLPFGKIRISYAQVGKDAPSYALLSYYSIANVADGWTSGNSFPVNGYVGLTQNDVLGNAELRPEKTKSFETGTDLRFIKNRIGLDVTYYESKSIDQILNVPIAGSTGFGFKVLNAGTIQNKGWEVVLNATIVKMKRFGWEMTINWSRNRNKVLELAPGIENLFLGGFENPSIRAVAGQPYGIIYGGKWLRDSNGNIVIDDFGQNSDPNGANYNPNLGYPIADNQVGVIGNTNPDWLGGMTNTLSWGQVSFSFVFDVRKGGDIWNGTRGALDFFGRTVETTNRGQMTVFDGVKGHYDANGNLVTSGETNNVSVPLDQAWYQGNGGGFGTVAEDFIEDGSYVRLRELELTYTIPQKALEKINIYQLDVSLIGRNVLLFTKYKGIDPETSLTGASNSQGMDYFNMPNTRSLGLALNLTF